MTGQSKGTGVIWRVLLVLLLDALTLLVLSEILPGFVLDGPGAALGAAALIGLVNALVWPVLTRFTLPLTVMTVGLAALVLNGLLVMVVIDALPRSEVGGLFEAIVITLVMSAVTAIVFSIFAIDEDDSWYVNVVKRQARRRGEFVTSDVPGVLFLEIDGLAHGVLRRALTDGSAPNLAAWLRSGTHQLAVWETDWSSQTGACQAGLLHGSNFDMPAFRWWEKDRGKAIVTNHPRDAEEIERRHSNGRGLLHEDGASRANILSGDAPHSMLTMSTALRRRKPIGKDYAAYFARPYGVARTFVLCLAEIGRERRAARSQVRDDVQPRIARSRTYALMRAWATVIQRDLQVAAVVGDVLAGRPVIYTTFLAYDEVAHHSGIERADALAVLNDLDRQIERISRACAEAPRPYRLVILSDHGQSQGATFLDRYDLSLEDLVRSATRDDSDIETQTGDEHAVSYLSAGLTEIARDDTVAARTVRAATRNRQDDGVVDLHADADAGERTKKSSRDEIPELSVMASGCLGLITFPRLPGRLTLEQIESHHPDLIPTLRDHPGIGFILVRSEGRGSMVIGKDGTRFLDDDRVEGIDPLQAFGPNAAAHVKRTDGFPHCPDIMVNSTFWPDFEEVAAFEELVGSHGGMGGPQSFPFVLHPTELQWPAEGVVGAENVHHVFRRWLAQLGHSAYASGSDSPGESTRTST